MDPLLVEACVAYHQHYLFADRLPASLDGIADVPEYVELLRSEDPFTAHYDAWEYEELLQPLLGGERAYVGVVLSVSREDGVISDGNPLQVEEVLPFTRAWYDGLKAKDEILAIGDPGAAEPRWLEGLTFEEARALFPRQEEEEKIFTVRRGSETTEVRSGAEEHIGFLLDGGLAYLSVRRFTEVTGQRVREDLEDLERQLRERDGTDKELTGLVLDLRDNGGGSVTGALDLADYLIAAELFAPQALLVSFADRDGDTDRRYLGSYADANRSGLSPDNFVVLANGGSASASEIVIAALRDYNTATLLGEETFGKGVRQAIQPLSDGSVLSIPSHYILSPNGESFHRQPILPHELVSVADLEPELDPQLEAAAAWLGDGSEGVSRGPRAAGSGRAGASAPGGAPNGVPPVRLH